MQREVNIEKVRQQAEDAFIQGDLHCSEAIVYSVRNNIDPSMPDAILAAASGFPTGVGGSKCMCGAVSGAVICLGYFFGRLYPTTLTDPKSQKCMLLAHELQEAFRQNHKVLCCHVHLKDLEMGSKQQMNQCASFTGEMAAKTAEIIARELCIPLVETKEEAAVC